MLSELRDCSDTRPYWAEVDGWSIDQLEALGHALVEQSYLAPYWAIDSVLEHVLRLLTSRPSADRTAAAVRIALGGMTKTAMRQLSERLASTQREQVLVSLLADLPPGILATELGACLLHDMILRRMSVSAVADVWEPRLAGHPLAELPLHALPGETRVPLPRHGLGADSVALPFGPSTVDPITAAGQVPDVTRETAPPNLTAAVANWLTQSNGRAEAAMYTLAPPLTPDDVGVRTLEALGLDCLAGGGLALRRASLDEVVALLFGAAAGGGAYSGLGNAYGRVEAWRSLSSLAGGTHVGCAWWIFDAANDWFHRVAWDLGVVCLRPGGHVMAVLAATDTD